MADKTFNKRWLFLLLMVASFSATFMTRFVWAPVSSTVTSVLSLSNASAGAFMSAFFIGYVITQIPGGNLVDRIGVKYILSLGILITGASTVAMSTINTYGAGFAIRILTGLGAGVVMSGCSKVISEFFEQSERGIAFGILLCGPTIGLKVANSLGAYLLTKYGWESAFIGIGAITTAIAVLVFFFVPNLKSEAHGSSDTEKITLLSGIKVVFTTRNEIAICLAGFFYMFMNLGTSTWANSYLTSIGFDTLAAAAVMSMYSYGGLLGSLLTGIIVKKFDLSAKRYLVFVYVIIAVITLIFGYQTKLGILKLVAFAFGFVSYLPNAHLNAMMLKYAPDRLSASVMGVQNCIFQIASIISPVVIGWTVDITVAFRACWYTLAAAPLIGIIFLLIINERASEV